MHLEHLSYEERLKELGWMAWRKAGSGDLTNVCNLKGECKEDRARRKQALHTEQNRKKPPRNCTEFLTGSTFSFCSTLLLLILHVGTTYGPSITFQEGIHEVKAGRTPSKAWNKNDKVNSSVLTSVENKSFV